MRALRRNVASTSDNFPQDVEELQSYFEPPAPNQRIRSYPGVGLRVPIWLLGSSGYSAELAAAIREKREPNASLRQCLPAMQTLERLAKSLA